MDQSVVSVMGVYKEFYRGEIHIPVLQGIDLEVLHGDYYALMGPSGSGAPACPYTDKHAHGRRSGTIMQSRHVIENYKSYVVNQGYYCRV